ncbi:MAG: cupin domain-containing protein [Burkholderiaceae bacterium]
MPKAAVISLDNEFSKIKFLENRTPETTDEQAQGAFARLSDYRDGAIFIVHYAGSSEWERHANGDEVVQVLSGETTLILLIDNQEHRSSLSSGQLLVVPKGVWHRFESPNGVKVMTVTPQPTDHSIERPNSEH